MMMYQNGIDLEMFLNKMKTNNDVVPFCVHLLIG
jgi:hypothetical protein